MRARVEKVDVFGWNKSIILLSQVSIYVEHSIQVSFPRQRQLLCKKIHLSINFDSFYFHHESPNGCMLLIVHLTCMFKLRSLIDIRLITSENLLSTIFGSLCCPPLLFSRYLETFFMASCKYVYGLIAHSHTPLYICIGLILLHRYM